MTVGGPEITAAQVPQPIQLGPTRSRRLAITTRHNWCYVSIRTDATYVALTCVSARTEKRKWHPAKHVGRPASQGLSLTADALRHGA